MQTPVHRATNYWNASKIFVKTRKHECRVGLEWGWRDQGLMRAQTPALADESQQKKSLSDEACRHG